MVYKKAKLQKQADKQWPLLIKSCGQKKFTKLSQSTEIQSAVFSFGIDQHWASHSNVLHSGIK